MHTLRVTHLNAVMHSRLATVTLQTPLLQAAQRLSETHIGLVVVCHPDGAMAGVISKSDIVRQIGHCLGSACQTLASELMTTKVIHLLPIHRPAAGRARLDAQAQPGSCAGAWP